MSILLTRNNQSRDWPRWKEWSPPESQSENNLILFLLVCVSIFFSFFCLKILISYLVYVRPRSPEDWSRVQGFGCSELGGAELVPDDIILGAIRGEGGFGVVHSATYKGRLGFEFAVKVLCWLNRASASLYMRHFVIINMTHVSYGDDGRETFVGPNSWIFAIN